MYVPKESLKQGRELRDGLLPVKVLDVSVSEVAITHYNPENEKVEKGYISISAVRSAKTASHLKQALIRGGFYLCIIVKFIRVLPINGLNRKHGNVHSALLYMV